MSSPRPEATAFGPGFVSTRDREAPSFGTGHRYRWSEAVRMGLAPDGGLFMPVDLPRLSDRVVEEIRSVSFGEAAVRIWEALSVGAEGGSEGSVGLDPTASRPPEASSADQVSLIRDALDLPLPVRRLDEGAPETGIWIAELFHGPTLSFKDFGARFLARTLARTRPEGAPEITVLTATSGDTGGAVADAFHGVSGTRAVVLFPREGVSPLQRAQFATTGGNVHAVEIDGSFDDAQRLVKRAFMDTELHRRVPLTSANSINIGRLLPQALYNLYAAARIPSGIPAPTVVVPSGNLGNLTAGVLARRMGAPVHDFVAAHNRNHAFVEYLRTGTFEGRPSVRTVSNAMDVGSPSNFERLEALFPDGVESMRAEIGAYSFDDEATLGAIRAVYERYGCVLDPHTAVGWLALGEQRNAGGSSHGSPRPALLLATAHPCKFPEVIGQALGFVPDPPSIVTELLSRTDRAQPLSAEYDLVRDHLLTLAGG